MVSDAQLDAAADLYGRLWDSGSDAPSDVVARLEHSDDRPTLWIRLDGSGTICLRREGRHKVSGPYDLSLSQLAERLAAADDLGLVPCEQLPPHRKEQAPVKPRYLGPEEFA